MENCLVKKLKAVVDNPNLPILGEEILIHVVKNNNITDGKKQQSIQLKGSKAFRIKAVGNGYFSTTYENLETDKFTSVNIEADTLTTIYVANETFDISVTETSYLTVLNVRANASQAYYSISHVNLADCKNLTSLVTLNLGYSLASYGDIADIGGLVNLSGTNCLVFLSNLVDGSIEDFVAGQVDAGATSRTDASFSASKLLNGHTTFGIITSAQPANPCVLQWEGKNKITLFIGNALNIASCTVVYAKGATAEEISAWQAAGKTVTDVDTGTVYPPAN